LWWDTPVREGLIFLGLLEVQGWLALFLTAWIGPSLISPGLTNNALQAASTSARLEISYTTD
jgi:hypothetical protein